MATTEASPSAALVKGKGKGAAAKGKGKVGLKDAEVDIFVSIATEVENYSSEMAVDKMKALMEDVYTNYFQIGGVLSVVQSNGWWQGYGFDSFKDFVVEYFGGSYRTAMYWLRIYEDLIEADIPWEAVKNVGWTKLKELSHILTKENVGEWVERAQSMTAVQLIAYIKSGAGKKLKKGHEDTDMAESKKLTTFSVKLHEDQKETIKEAISQAREEAETEFDAVALEAICMNYLSGGSAKAPAKAVTLEEVMKQSSWEEVLGVFEKVFPKVDLVAKV